MDLARLEHTSLLNRWLSALPSRLQSLGYTPVDDERIPDFAAHFVERVPDILMPNRPTSSQLCNSCSSVRIGRLIESSRRVHDTFFSTISELRKSAESCKLCEIILSSIEKIGTGFVGGIHFIMTPQSLMIELLNDARSKPDYGYLRLCADPGK